MERIRAWAAELGFSGVGVAVAERLDGEEPRLAQWLAEGQHGDMGYLGRNFEKRLDPRLLLPGTKTVISLLYNHYTDVKQEDPEAPRISTYAYGEDYHFVVKWKLKELLKWMRRDWGDIAGRVYVDSAPILERAWAARSGLGWVGKHGLLLNKEGGSHFFLGEILVDLELPPDGPVTDHCGSCTRCWMPALQGRSSALRWSMAASASVISPSNCGMPCPSPWRAALRIGCLAVISVRKSVHGTATPRRTRSRHSCPSRSCWP